MKVMKRKVVSVNCPVVWSTRSVTSNFHHRKDSFTTNPQAWFRLVQQDRGSCKSMEKMVDVVIADWFWWSPSFLFKWPHSVIELHGFFDAITSAYGAVINLVEPSSKSKSFHWKVHPCLELEMVMLHWMSREKDLKQFVKDRVKAMKEKTEGAVWRHCPLKENPADLLEELPQR